MTPPQRTTYLRLFEERLKRTYRAKIANYGNERMVIDFPNATARAPDDTSGPGSPRKRTAQISIEVDTGGETATILHKFRVADGQWKLYDVEIQGVSILLTYRSQFDDLLKSDTVEAFFERLQETPR